MQWLGSRTVRELPRTALPKKVEAPSIKLFEKAFALLFNGAIREAASFLDFFAFLFFLGLRF